MSLRNRREFLSDAGRLSAVLASAGLLNPIRADEPKAIKPITETSPGNRLRVALIGANGKKGRGYEHVGFIAGKNGCEIVTICDCDEAVVGPSIEKADQQQGRAPKYVKDLRKVIDDPSIDVISIATPNHWHALAAIWAMRAGKHVYVEKPVSHNVSEGRRIVEAARYYQRVCQTGTQCRSMTSNIEAVEFLRSGKLGKVSLARGLCYKPRPTIGKVGGDGSIPASIDYDLWCGPAPKRPPQREKLHYDWHWQWDYGNGDFGNQGIHQVDVARWGLGKSEMPKTVFSLGGRFGYVDDGQTANTQVCVFDYGDCKLMFEVRGLMTPDVLADERGNPTAKKEMQAKVGNVFYGTEGVLVCTTYTDAVAVSKDDEIVRVFKAKKEDDHFGNFAAAVRAHDPKLLHADIEEGHLSSALCHLGNISYRMGREMPFDSSEVRKCSRSTDCPATQATVGRMIAHLEKNGVKLGDVPCRVGEILTIDGKTERFVGNDKANQWLGREYRKGFEVPTRF